MGIARWDRAEPRGRQAHAERRWVHAWETGRWQGNGKVRRGALAHLAEPRRRLTTLRTAAALTVGRLGYAAPQHSIPQSATASPSTPFSSALSYQRGWCFGRALLFLGEVLPLAALTFRPSQDEHAQDELVPSCTRDATSLPNRSTNYSRMATQECTLTSVSIKSNHIIHSTGRIE